jgi:hypothetical protein
VNWAQRVRRVPGRLLGRNRELHALGGQIGVGGVDVVGLEPEVRHPLAVVAAGTRGDVEDHEVGVPRQLHLDPPGALGIVPHGGVELDLSAELGGPELQGPFLVPDVDGREADARDHRSLLVGYSE